MCRLGDPLELPQGGVLEVDGETSLAKGSLEPALDQAVLPAALGDLNLLEGFDCGVHYGAKMGCLFEFVKKKMQKSFRH